MPDARDTPPPVLVAIGGGGATHGTHPGLDLLCLAHLPPGPVIGYVGAANGDDPEKLARVRDAFGPHARAVVPLPMTAGAAAARAWAAGVDMIYVGGGNPVRLIGHWRSRGIDRVLAGAARRGTVLAGVSAGAMCWFEGFLWRDPLRGLVPGRGLGLVPGAVTPHTLAEPDRLAALVACVRTGRLPDAFGIDDGAALVMAGGAPAAVHPSAGPPHVHRLRRTGAGVETRLLS